MKPTHITISAATAANIAKLLERMAQEECNNDAGFAAAELRGLIAADVEEPEPHPEPIDPDEDTADIDPDTEQAMLDACDPEDWQNP